MASRASPTEVAMAFSSSSSIQGLVFCCTRMASMLPTRGIGVASTYEAIGQRDRDQR